MGGVGLARKNGVDIDTAIEKSIQSGFFAGRSSGDLTQNEFMEQVIGSLNEPVYSPANFNQSQSELFREIEEVQSQLEG